MSGSGSGSDGRGRVMNVNVGVLGHVDSGKTSLAKALSTIGSTASFDKSPQSQERGITLDLGFSAVHTTLGLSREAANGDAAATGRREEEETRPLQFTLVDCPGHASLIRTIMGGAQIIDFMMLVVDAGKGIQTQTAECMVIGEILQRPQLIVLNKVDVFDGPDADEKAKKIAGMSAKLKRAFSGLSMFRSAKIIPVSAKTGEGIAVLLDEMKRMVLSGSIHRVIPGLEWLSLSTKKEGGAEKEEAGQGGGASSSTSEDEFLFAVDHCFSIKGQGSVVTGTVLFGRVKLGQSVHFPELQLDRKVKSMQIFKKPVQDAVLGDRVAICVTNMDASAMERGLVCSPAGFVSKVGVCVARVKKVKFHKRNIDTGDKLHFTIGHSTVMGSVQFFDGATGQHVDSLVDQGDKDDDAQSYANSKVDAIIRFEHPVWMPPLHTHPRLIASRLETDVHANVCRLAFHGECSQLFASEDQMLAENKILIWKPKRKEGVVDRLLINERSVLAKNMFEKDADLTVFQGLKIKWGDRVGVFDAPFGKSGKFKVRFNGVDDWSQAEEWAKTDPLLLEFRKYVFGNPPTSAKTRFVQM
eukprot:ANDGO_05199.mRNA.1 Selenocysteine-specific elongation factor